MKPAKFQEERERLLAGSGAQLQDYGDLLHDVRFVNLTKQKSDEADRFLCCLWCVGRWAGSSEVGLGVMDDEEDGTHHHDESARGVSSNSSSRHAQKILQLAPVFWHDAGRDENLEPQLRIWADRRLTILFKPSMAWRVYLPLFFLFEPEGEGTMNNNFPG